MDVACLDDLVDVNVVGVQDLRVVQGRENGCFQRFWEKGVLVGGLEAADARLQAFLFAEEVVEEADVFVGD